MCVCHTPVIVSTAHNRNLRAPGLSGGGSVGKRRTRQPQQRAGVERRRRRRLQRQPTGTPHGWPLHLPRL